MHADAGMFSLVIALGASLQTYEDVAVALEDVARQVGQGSDRGSISDARGDTVGHWRFYDA